jgi:tyrosine-protein kinase Etk/Wzc
MTTHLENQYTPVIPEERPINYNRLLRKYLSFWPWFTVSVITCLCIGYVYSSCSVPMYKISARILVNDDKKGGGLSASKDVIGNLGGLLGTKSTVDNEVEVLKTKYLMERVVRDLKLNITYFIKGSFGQYNELYTSPFLINRFNMEDSVASIYFKVRRVSTNTVALAGENIDTVVNYNAKVKLPGIGYIQVTRNRAVPFSAEDYSFSSQSVRSKVAQIESNLSALVGNKQITIIDLILNNPVPKKGEDILNRLIYNYVQENLRGKNEVADSTIAFINRRLMIISSDLGEAETSIQTFKQKNNLADMSEQGKLLVISSGEYVSELAKVETQISIVKSLQDYLKDSGRNKRVLPSALASPDIVFTGAIEKYNTLVLERGRMLIGLSEANPIILNLDKEISNARKDIESNLGSTLVGLDITHSRLKRQMEGAEGKIQQVPTTERNYLRLARQQQIKQELFIFLMQKSEETAISKTANLANSRTIDPPQAELIPFAPKKMNIQLLSLAFGFMLPLLIISIKELFNDKVQSKDDILENTVVPIIGEISHNSVVDSLAVASNNRSAISEQFRALRTNLNFYLKSKDEKIILITSSMAGEGKSFVAINLGSILALAGFKVCLMELDLRKPGLSSKLGVSSTAGFTNYVISDLVEVNDVITPLNIHKNLFLVSSGPLPPNPAETLMNERTNLLLNELRSQFDYIIIDAPPVGIVTDAQLLSSHSHMCLYLVRQGYTRKEQISIVQELYASEKMKTIGIVVNDIPISGGYGYGYGYGYGDYNKDVSKRKLAS